MIDYMFKLNNLVVMFFVISSSLSCTLLKLDEYRECSTDSDCMAYFQRCDQELFCVEEGALCKWSHRFDLSEDIVPPASESRPIGVLAPLNDLSNHGIMKSALLGLHSGLSTVSTITQETHPSILICDPSPSNRVQVLSAMREYGIKVIIGTPLQALDETMKVELNAINDEIAGDEVYLSIGLDYRGRLLTITNEFTGSRWINLAPSFEEVDRALEQLSSMVIDQIIKTNEAFSIFSAIKVRTEQLRFIEDFPALLASFFQEEDSVSDLIWRIAPYPESVFRTLYVYYNDVFKTDRDVNQFFDSPRPLRLLAMAPTLQNAQITDLIETSVNESDLQSTATPLYLMAPHWDFSEFTNTEQTFWTSTIKLTVLMGQYQVLEGDQLNEEENMRAQTLQFSSVSEATRNGGLANVVTPYFGLSYDAAVLSILINSLIKNNASPLNALAQLTTPNQSGRIYLTESELTAFISLSPSRDFLGNGRQLVGLSGPIFNRIGSNIGLKPLLVCGRDRQNPQVFPLDRLLEPSIVSARDGIENWYEMTTEILEGCILP